MTDYSPAEEGFANQDGLAQGMSPSLAEGGAGVQNWWPSSATTGSTRYLEKMPGLSPDEQRVPLPKDEQDVQAYENIYKALGRPDHPDGYGLNELAAQDSRIDPGFLGHMSVSMHQLGLNGRQAQGLVKAYQAAASRYQAETQQNQTAELRELRVQMGGAFEAQVDCARRAAQKFGLDLNALNTLENAVGSATLIKHLARIGKSLGEEVRVDGRTGSSFSLSPAGARQKADDLLNDRNFRERYLAGDRHALNKITQLLEVGVDNGSDY